MGRLGSFRPTRPRRMARATAFSGLVLAHHPLVEGVLHVQQPLALVLGETGDGDAGPAGHHSEIARVTGRCLCVVLPAPVTLQFHLLPVVLLDVPQLGGFS